MNDVRTNLKKWAQLFVFISSLLVAGCTGMSDLGSVLDLTEQATDKTPPILSVTSVSNGQEVGNIFTLGGSVSDAGSGVSQVFVSIDGGPYSAVTPSSGNWTTTISLSLCGVHTNSVYATDKSGNASPAVTVLVERTTIPGITMSIADNAAVNTWSMTVSGTAVIDSPETISEVALSVNGGDYTNVGNTVWSKTGVVLTPNATNTLQARAIGGNGKTNFTSLVHLIVDCDGPLLSSTIPQYLISTYYSLNISAVDDLSGVSALVYRLNGGAYVTVSGTNVVVSGLTNGMNTIIIYGTDNAGNSTNISVSTTVNTIGIYVATNGNDTNNGFTVHSPVKSVQIAISNAVVFGLNKVHVAQGVYTPGAGLNSSISGVVISNNNVQLFGGYSADYSTRTGMSTLDGTNGLYHVINSSAFFVLIDGFIITRGKANSTNADSCGGGIYSSGAYITITNSTIVSNFAASGGGIYFPSTGSFSSIRCNIIYNTATNGGGINTCAMYTTVSATISNNYAYGNGGGIYIDSIATFANISGNINSNTTVSSGGGIYMTHSIWTSISGNVCSNSAGTGGGIYSDYGLYPNINAHVVGNGVSTSGGGIFLSYAVGGSTISGTICNNNASSGGGGIMLWYCPSAIINNAVITNNNASMGVITMMFCGGLQLNGCLIGGNTGTGHGIYEYLQDSVNLTLNSNTFITNKLGYLYYDFTRGNIGITEINKLNSTNVGGINWTGATVATNNIATNI